MAPADQTWSQAAHIVARTKVCIRLEKGTLNGMPWPPYDTESLWADVDEPVEATLLNSPFFAKGLSYLDKLEIDESGPNDVAKVLGVLAHSGHGTIRAILTTTKMMSQADSAIEEIERLGRTWESDGGAVLAIDVPPKVRSQDVLTVLNAAQAKGLLYVDVGFLP